MNYIDICFQDIEGWNEISVKAEEVFKRVYKLHNSCQGTDYKKEWIPVKVKEHKKYLEVHFANGGWLHYLPNGTWY